MSKSEQLVQNCGWDKNHPFSEKPGNWVGGDVETLGCGCKVCPTSREGMGGQLPGSTQTQRENSEQENL